MKKLRFGILSCAGIAHKKFIPAAAIAGNPVISAKKNGARVNA